MWQPSWPAISAALGKWGRVPRSTLSPCQVIAILLGLGYYARVTAPRTNRALHTSELTYQGDSCDQIVKQSSQMKTSYDSFVPCKANRNSYIIPDTVMKSRYTNVKYVKFNCEISRCISVHRLPHLLRNYKEEAKINPSENTLAMPGQKQKQNKANKNKTKAKKLTKKSPVHNKQTSYIQSCLAVPDTRMMSCQWSPMAPACSSPHNSDGPPCSMPMNAPAKKPQTAARAALPVALWPVFVPVHVTSDPSVDPMTSRTPTGVSSTLLTAGQ